MALTHPTMDNKSCLLMEISGNFKQLLNRGNTMFLPQDLLHKEAQKKKYLSKAEFLS